MAECNSIPELAILPLKGMSEQRAYYSDRSKIRFLKIGGLSMLIKMKRYVFILIIGLVVISTLVWAESQISLNIIKNKVDVIMSEADGQNPYVYNPKILALQQKLNRVLSFNLLAYTNIAETGFLNSETTNAILIFRKMYYKKYNLQQYFTFSAVQSVDINVANELLNYEVPSPAHFLQRNQQLMQNKLSDPAGYYGQSAQNEIQRIEKGLMGDVVDPVMGELDKNILLYQSPIGNDKLMPISLSACYGSQYTGNAGLGTGWYLTENYSLWFSVEKNQVIIQDGSGISQLFQYRSSKADGTDSSGSQGISPSIKDGPINGFSRVGETTDGGYFKDIRMNGVPGCGGSSITVTTSKGDILVFTINIHIAGDTCGDVLNCLNNIPAPYSVGGYSIYNDIAPGSTAAPDMMGVFCGLSGESNNNDIPTSYVLNKVSFLSDIALNGWSVNLFFYAFGNANYGGYFRSFRRSPQNLPNSYAGYFLTSVTNRYGAYKNYQYTADWKLSDIGSFAPNSTNQIDHVSIVNNKDPDGNNYISGIICQNGAVSFTYNSPYVMRMEPVGVLITNYNGTCLNYNLSYNLYNISSFNNPDMITISNSLISNIMSLKNEIAITSGPNPSLPLGPSDLAIQDMSQAAELKVASSNYIIATNQLAEFNQGMFFTKLSLLQKSSINGSRQEEYNYVNYTTNIFNVTNAALRIRLNELDTPYGSGRFTYQAGNTGFIDPNGNAYHFNYDTSSTNYTERRITNIINADNSSVFLNYDINGNITYLKNENSQEYIYTYNGFGNVLIKETPGLNNADRQKWTFSYDGGIAQYLNEPRTISQPDGSVYSMAYNASGDLTNRSKTGNGQTINILSVNITSNSAGFAVNEADYEGNTTLYNYDKAWSILNVQYPDNSISFYSNNTFGKHLTERKAGVTYFHLYNSLGYLTNQGILNSDGSKTSVVSTFYDAFCEKTAIIDPLGNKTIYQYDSGGRLSSMVYSDKLSVNYGYDPNGDKISEDYGGGKTVTYSYNARGEIVNKLLNQTGHSYSYVFIYDAAGTLTNQKAIGRGFSSSNDTVMDVSYQYNSIGLLMLETNNLFGSSINYSYNTENKMTMERHVKSGKVFTKQYIYDLLNRQILVQAMWDTDSGFTTLESNYYQPNSSIINKTDAYGNTSTIFKDFRGNVTNLTYNVFNPKSGNMDVYSHSYAYDAYGNKTNETFPDGTIQNWGFTNGTWPLWEGKRRNKSDTFTFYRNYTTNPSGRVITIKDFENNSWSKTYDIRGFLTSVTDPDHYQTQYKNDIFGNPIQIIQGSRTKQIVYDLLNKPIQNTWADGSIDRLDYDALGDQTVQIPGSDPNLQTLAWFDHEGHKIREAYPSGLVNEWQYDAAGDLVKQTQKSSSAGQVPPAKIHIYSYDTVGRIIGETLPDKSTITYSYQMDNNQ